MVIHMMTGQFQPKLKFTMPLEKPYKCASALLNWRPSSAMASETALHTLLGDDCKDQA